MKSFTQHILNEGTTAGKNLHLEHIEDEIINFGVPGGRAAINFIQSLRDMFAGEAKSKVDISVKWDGAPAIFAGIDPTDGKFFVGTKGVFANNPKLVKSNADLDEHGYKGGLRDKLQVALKYLPSIGIKGVLQGDMMFTQDDLSTTTIGGKEYIIFQPNTIVYAVPVDSPAAKKIQAAKMGVVWHTTYSGGKTLADMKASFGASVSGLKKSRNVWYEDASYRDVSGTMLFTKAETTEITRYLSRAGTVFQKINSRSLKRFLDMQDNLGGATGGAWSGSGFKTYNNSKVRAGEKVTNARAHALGYAKYFEDWWRVSQIDKAKMPATKKRKEALMKEHLRVIRQSRETLIQLVEFQGHLLDAKAFILGKLDTGARRMARTFIKTKTGYKVTPDEGYVVVDRMKGNAVKLVDRLEFSYNNFTAIKNWDK
jgi:hypothetical protein